MQEIVHQLGELFLQAVPTVLIVLIFYGILRTLFFVPLMKVMDERQARTAGARKASESAQTAAANKLKQYQDALKQARAKVYAEQEDARKKLLNDRAEALKQARGKAAGHVASAKERVAREFETAKQDIESSVAQLATEIAQRVIQIPPPRPNSPVREVS
jgi:F-type H+-transporting ATPase subunit b